MKTLLNIYAQVYENYGENQYPIWKAKGGQIFQTRVDMNDFMYVENDCIKALKKLVRENSNDYIKFEYVSHELIFSEPIIIEEEKFEETLNSFFKMEQTII